MKTKNYGILFISLVSILFLSGCDSLPDAVLKQARAIPDSVKEMTAIVDRHKSAFDAQQKSDEWSFLQPYAETEKWTDEFTQATKAVAHADDIYQKQVMPLLKKNESKDTSTLQVHLFKIKKSFDEARQLSGKPAERQAFLLKARAEAPQWVKTAQTETAETDQLLVASTVFVKKAQADYPAKSTDITGRFAALRKLGDDAHAALKTAQAELGKVDSGKANYATLGDSTKLISAKLATLKDQKTKLKATLDELYRSYSKTLVDMRVDHYVDIGRTSWDDASDWDTSKNHVYTIQVDENVSNYFDGLGEGVLATYSCFFGCNTKVAIDKSRWNALSINVKASWPSSSHDASEFWVSNVYTKTYHKYTVVENGVKKDTDWVNVAEDTYWAQEENLGLTIVSKPYGMYEEETLKSAAPPGMEYVSKPTMVGNRATGKNQYGEWRQDTSGNSFWHYYGQYAFMSSMLGSNHRYYYDDYHGYSGRGSGHYYGRNDGYGTYGSRTYDNTRYSGSTYAKSNQSVVTGAKANRSSGRTQTASVRGAGSSNRGRGPGKGGK